MANPQVENGYTIIANELLEAIYRIPLSDYEHRVFWFIVRKTYGYKKKIDWIAQKQIVEETDILKENVSRTIKKLYQKNIIIRNGRKIGIQKDYELWKLSKEITISATKKLSKEITKVIHTDNKVISTDNKKLSIQTPTKERKKPLQKKHIQKKDFTPYKLIRNTFNTICVSLPKADELTKKRKRILKALFNKYGLVKIKEVFTIAEESNFLSGRNGDWRSSFDWLIQEDNMVKVLEGNYKRDKKIDGKKYRSV